MICTLVKLQKGPAKLIKILNELITRSIALEPKAGPGLEEYQTRDGKQLRFNSAAMSMLRDYQSATSGVTAPIGSDQNQNNPFGGSGTGLPNTTRDAHGKAADPNGNTLDWRELKVCVDSGSGFVPMTLSVYGALY